MVWWKRDGKARQPEEPLPEPLPCPVCNGHAEAVIDMYTIGGYAGQDDFWGCRCSVCGYGFFGATGGPRSEREAISRWEILVRNTLDVIAEPLEECPKCHIAPEVKQNVVEGQAFLQCPKCLEAVCGDAPRGGQVQVEPPMQTQAGGEAQGGATGQIAGTSHRRGRGLMNAKDYGHHFSGYRKPEATEPSQGFMSRLVFWILVFAVCIGWVMTHTGCAHPIENGLAALMGFGCVPLRLLCLVLSEAGVE